MNPKYYRGFKGGSRPPPQKEYRGFKGGRAPAPRYRRSGRIKGY